MIYRQATPSDFSQLALMRWDFRNELGHEQIQPALKEQFLQEMLDFLAEAYTNGRWGIWLAGQNGKIVSHVYIQRIRKVPRPTRFDAEMGYLTNMYTLPEYRGQGIGAELLRHALNWARGQQLEMVILWPAEGRQAFYTRGGFVPEKEALVQVLERV